ncbi:MAG: DUF4162 domain-containing protein, partial [Pirellulales bacterium]|nr:DUF4162 domain-containing protein [Pirellulales bacterium]
IDSIRQAHGECQLKVRMAGNQPVPETLAGITGQTEQETYTLLRLEHESVRPEIYHHLARHGDVEHFETVRPTLHDIFVRIAKPDASPGQAAAEDTDHA